MNYKNKYPIKIPPEADLVNLVKNLSKEIVASLEEAARAENLSVEEVVKKIISDEEYLKKIKEKNFSESQKHA